MWIYNNELIKAKKQITIGGVTYPPQMFSNKELRESLGIKQYELVREPFDSKYYWEGQTVRTETDTTVTDTITRGEARLVQDRLEVNEDGTPMLDQDGKQVVTKGLVSALKERKSQEFKTKIARPRVDTGLGFDVDGSYQDLQNFIVGKEFGILDIKDADGNIHTITLTDYDVIITAIKAKGLELYQAKWTEEATIDAITTLEELIAYEANN